MVLVSLGKLSYCLCSPLPLSPSRDHTVRPCGGLPVMASKEKVYKTQIRHGVIGHNPDGTWIYGDYVAGYVEGKPHEFIKSGPAIEKYRYDLENQAIAVLKELKQWEERIEQHGKSTSA